MQNVDANLHALVACALQKLQSHAINTAEISLSQTSGFSVTARLGDVETMEHHLDKNFSVTVYQNYCTGSASSSDFSEAAIFTTIEKALTIARFANPDSYAGLADPARLAKNIPDCDLYHPWDISPRDAIQLAIECEKKAVSFDKRITNSEGANISTLNSRAIYANTLGFLGDYHVSQHTISCSLIASDNNKMQRNDEYTTARNHHDLQSIDDVAKRAAEKTIHRLNPKRLKTQSSPIIFEASVAKSLLRSFVQAISGGNLYRQSSFLLHALGKPVFPAFIQIYQQPHLLSALGSAPFDSEGVATIDQHYIHAGELVNYALGSYSARKLSMQTTGNAGGVFNLSINSGNQETTLKQLMQKMHKGLLVTELMGQGVNITTGDYSRGAAGFWIDHGEIQFPVEEITIAGNLKSIFAGIVAVSNDIDIRSSIRTGSILVDQMTIAGE